jgi:hypothetical protein
MIARMPLMGKTSNRPDFGTEGNEGNEGQNDFLGDLVSLRIFWDLGLSLLPHRPGRLEFISGLDFRIFSFSAFFGVWTFGVWDLVRRSHLNPRKAVRSAVKTPTSVGWV